MAAFMPRFMSGSCPTCSKAPVFSFAASGAEAAAADPRAPAAFVASGALELSKPGAVELLQTSSVQSANQFVVGAAVTAESLWHSAGCAPAEPGENPTAATANAAAHRWRTRLCVMRSARCLGRRPPQTPCWGERYPDAGPASRARVRRCGLAARQGDWATPRESAPTYFGAPSS